MHDKNAKRGALSGSPFAQFVARRQSLQGITGGRTPQKRCVNKCKESRQVGVTLLYFPPCTSLQSPFTPVQRRLQAEIIKENRHATAAILFSVGPP
jgi:hypothetical protein